MRGAIFLGERRLQLVEFPDPAPGPGEVIVEIKASGMSAAISSSIARPAVLLRLGSER